MKGLIKIVKGHPIRWGMILLFLLGFLFLRWGEGLLPSEPLKHPIQGEIAKIRVKDPQDFAFAVLGDNKGSTLIFDSILDDIARDPEIAFVIDCGDLVPDGKKGQFRRFLRQIKKRLSLPFLTVMGNHDRKGGKETYRGIFGEIHYSFEINGVYFIVLDATEESGLKEKEWGWLKGVLKRSQGAKARLIFMHVPPLDPRGGGHHKCLKDGKELLALFARWGISHLFASHIHGFFQGVAEGVPYTITGGAGGRLEGDDPTHYFYHYLKVRLQGGKVKIEVRRVKGEEGYLLRYLSGHIAEGFLLVAVLLLISLLIRRRRNVSEDS